MLIPTHNYQLFLFHTFFDNVKRAQVDEIRRQHAEACAKLLLEEEHNKKTNKKTTYGPACVLNDQELVN
jgi:hypothetical protein